MNRVIMLGYLASDPELRTTQSGISNCTFRLAVQRQYKGKDGNRETDFFSVVCWRQTAEFCANYLGKGRKIAIEGSLQNRSYDAQDGSKRYVTEIIADSVVACDRMTDRDDKNREYPQNYSQPPQPANNAPRDRQMDMREIPRANDGFVEVDDDELPF